MPFGIDWVRQVAIKRAFEWLRDPVLGRKTRWCKKQVKYEKEKKRHVRRDKAKDDDSYVNYDVSVAVHCHFSSN